MNLCGDVLETKRGERMVCSLPANHQGAHESQDYEWWNDKSNALTVHLALSAPKWRAIDDLQFCRIQDRIERHILSGPERESFALSEWRRKTK